MDPIGFDDDPPPEPRDGWLLVRIHVPELNVYKCLQFPSERLVWDVKQQVLASLPKELKESFNYGLFCPPSNGKAGKFLDEERRLGDYPFNGPVGYLELKYKRRVYKMLNLDEKQLKALHTRANLRRFLECVNGSHVEKIAKMCAKGLDPNFHCPETGDTPLTLATGTKKPNKLLIALVNGGALLDYRNRVGETALHKAVEKDCLEAVTTLLELGASPNYKDARGLTPLYLSVTKKTDSKICESLLHDHGTLGTQDTQGWQEVHQVAVIAGNLELAEMIQNYKAEDIVPFRVPPRYNPRRRSGIGWGTTISTRGPPSPCPSEHPFSSASSSLSEGSSGHRSHEDDISIVTGLLYPIDKSIGDTSDIISDSSGVGTNSDSAACSIGHPSTTVVCMEPYQGTSLGHLSIHPGEVIEVVGSTDCGLLEGYVRGVNRSGFFPAHCVQEVNIRQKNITNVSISMPSYRNENSEMEKQQLQQPDQYVPSQYNSSTGPRIKKNGISDARTVILHRAKRGFGFVLRGAKAASPLMQLKPSDRCPGLQYLDDVDPGGVADLSGLKPGDFLLEINGEDVRCASHEHVVDLIRTSGSLVSMTVVSQSYPNNFQQQVQSHQQAFATPSSGRQCATLPRKMPFGPGKMPAPMPPRRDPKTTLSVGRARAKSMVAGLEGSGDKDDDDELTGTNKSSSAESIHQQSLSAASTPTQAGPGTPTQPRTASIKARPTSSRITAAELEELFQRQQGETNNGNRYSTMMSSSRFQSGTDSGAATPPLSPQKGPIVYASVADMKRKKTKNGTLRGKPCEIPQVNSDLKRTFHSTPDLQTAINTSSSSIWSNTIGVKGHRSQDDMYAIQRLNLPPPTHPPPPPPVVGQVVKVDVSRGSEYESTAKLQQKLRAASIATDDPNEVRSSFKPATNAKLYASPQDLRNLGYHPKAEQTTAPRQIRKTSSLRGTTNVTNNGNQYAQPIRGGLQQRSNTIPAKLSAPPIPDPDYSLSESEGEDENSVLVAHNTKMNEHIALMPSESSGNSNTSGSSTGSSSIPHSFSVDEIQKMRVKLKSSKSYPNELLRQDCHIIRPAEHNEEGDNSSSGVSSDQEVTITTNDTHTKTIIELKKPVTLPVLTNLKKTTIINDKDERSDEDDSPSPPAKGFQRHNSLTRKQAATIAMNRAMQSRNAVSLVKLPPPMETEMEVDPVAIPPPPQFCDCLNAKSDSNKNATRGVRIVGAVPKVNKTNI
ncbi:SH3 and multiple ankyrin repeat domains protein 3 isoform X4 [Bradysia coprophila]|uniref:SH3 and multiple ankyrin repeat domains protein 3 isoform X4 n=1 Tax=Bradysia coprophila TaxID=38358 RepID=UPI00187D95BA|nr:SH3 and multiple ankyrin repeat domains protein 3 isoform X4 [Bradysia coprophila]